jgi:hypothetical protein
MARTQISISAAWLTAALIVFSLVVIPRADAACITRHRVPIASGPSPEGQTWTVEGGIGNNGSCREWLFGMEFRLPGTVNWGSATGIPAGGHLSSSYTIGASDDLQEDGAWRVLSGLVAGDVAKVTATLSNGKRLTFKPRSASEALRRKVVWLRNVRYFVQYYPPTGFVTSASLFSASGQLLYRTSGSQLF